MFSLKSVNECPYHFKEKLSFYIKILVLVLMIALILMGQNYFRLYFDNTIPYRFCQVPGKLLNGVLKKRRRFYVVFLV